MPLTYFAIIPHNSLDYQKAVDLRYDVLRKPLGLTFNINDLAQEKNFIHIVGKIQNEVIATAMLVPEKDRIKMKQVAVAIHLQNQGIGSTLLQFTHACALQNHFTHIYCHARNEAMNFYLQNGYEKTGEPFLEIGILHWTMQNILTKNFT